MTLIEAIILGIVEGLTEYLPVSSTGHLLLAKHLMGIGQGELEKVAADAYIIFIQGGAILSVIWLYWHRIAMLFRGVFFGDAAGRKLFVNLLAAFFPAAVFGLLFEKQIKVYLFGLWPVVIAWFFGGVAIIAITSRRGGTLATEKRAELLSLDVKKSFCIGLLQCVAMWPGVSRSLVTIVGGLLVGLELQAALEFSFLLGVVTLGAATVYEVIAHGETIITHFSLSYSLVGFFVAFLSGVCAIKWMLSFLTKHSFSVFGWYRIGLAGIVTALLLLRN